MEALREENSRLRQKIEADQAAGEPYQPRSRADIPRASASATPSTLSLSLRCTHCHHTLRPPPSASATTSRASALHFASLSVALSLASSLSPLHPLPPHSPATVDLLRPLATTFGQCNHHASEPPPFCISLCRSLSLSGHRRPPATTSRFFSSNCSTAIPPRYVSNSFLFHFPFCIYYFWISIIASIDFHWNWNCLDCLYILWVSLSFPFEIQYENYVLSPNFHFDKTTYFLIR